MTSISIAEALGFAEENYPNAPEELVKHLGIELRFSPLNCDGWCLQVGDRALIRINSESAEVRRRFTLAHELGHLILGFPTVVGESVSEYQRAISEEEKLVNSVAAKILLPQRKVLDSIKEIPVTATAIRKLAKSAKVSELFVARRLTSLARDLGLKGGLVIYYRESKFQWQWSKTLEVTNSWAARIRKQCLSEQPNPARIRRKAENDVIVGSILENPGQDSQIIFVQLVHEVDGLKQLDEERRRELEKFVFSGDEKFRMSLAGCFGATKPHLLGKTLDEAMAIFRTRYMKNADRFGLEAYGRLTFSDGLEYLRIRLSNLIS